MKKLFRLIKKILIVFVLILLIPFLINNGKTIYNNLNPLDKNLRPLSHDIKNFLNDNYKDYYNIKSYKFESIKKNDGYELIVSAKTKIKVKPEKFPFVKGLLDSNNKSPEFKDFTNMTIENIKNKSSKYYPIRFSFFIPYGEYNLDSLFINKEEKTKISALELDEDNLYKRGLYFGENFKGVRKPKYNTMDSVNYAISNWDKEPQYKNDCANFVSKSLLSGGIEKSNSFYEGSINFISTGFKNNGTGLTQEMVNRDIFRKVKTRSLVCEASILYWNNYSHVALITYNDTLTMRYTAHTKAKLNEVAPEKANFTFYSPL